MDAFTMYDVGIGLFHWFWLLLAVACMSTLALALMAKSKGQGKRAVEEPPRVRKAIGHKKTKPTKDKGEASKKRESSKKGGGEEKEDKEHKRWVSKLKNRKFTCERALVRQGLPNTV